MLGSDASFISTSGLLGHCNLNSVFNTYNHIQVLYRTLHELIKSRHKVFEFN